MTSSLDLLGPPATDGGVVGRDQELRALYALIEAVETGGTALIVRGPAGIGKSALLVAARRHADTRGSRTLHTLGIQSETDLPFAGLHQILHPVLAGANELPDPQRAALLAAFGADSSSTPDLFLIALGTLNLLSNAATNSPILLVADDAQWLDPATADVLAFVARRLEMEPIVMLAAIREGHASPLLETDAAQLSVGPLDETSAQAVLSARAPALTELDRRQLLLEAAGNPLALVELAVTTRLEPVAARASGPVPLTERLERAFAAQEAELPADTQTLLLVASADDGARVDEILAAASVVAGREVSAESLTPAVAARVVAVDGPDVHFRHPLIRSAIYQAATVPERRSAHAALAEVLVSDRDRRTWHRAASSGAPDETIAAELEALAGRAKRRGAVTTALAALERSARLTSDSERGCERLLLAAELAFELGRIDLVQALVEEAERLPAAARQRARITWIRESFTDGVPGDPTRIYALVDAAQECSSGGQTDLALSLLMGAALRSWWTDPGEDACRAVVTTAEQLDVAADDPRLIAVIAVAGPIMRGATVIERLSRLAGAGGRDAHTAALLAEAAHAVYEFDRAPQFSDEATAALRAQGRLAVLAQVLTMAAWDAIHLGDFHEAASKADEAGRLARETAQPIWIAGTQVAMALLAGLRGDEDGAETLLAEAELITIPKRLSAILSVGALARGLTALGAGRPSDAFEHLTRMFDPTDAAFHHIDRFSGISHLADAALLSGNQNTARAIISDLGPLLEQTPSMGLRIGILYARPILATDDDAEAHFLEALAGEPARWPFMRARLQLEYGAWLRRHRRNADSRAPLRIAAETFDALGTAPWSERARVELRASGETTRRRAPDTRNQLTPQELQIAEMAAAGLSNREIGQQLYLSHRTVASHLYRLFPKLGITSRSQLNATLPLTNVARS